jgi:pimeloyl-ACP methyl ester carboxylesterase
VVAVLEAGEIERGTRHFVEEIALGPGMWDVLPEPIQAMSMGNAPTFVAEQRDPDGREVDTDAVEGFDGPVMLTKGDSSPLWAQLLIDRLGELIPSAEIATIADAGHTPHLTHSAEYAALVEAFARDAEGAAR